MINGKTVLTNEFFNKGKLESKKQLANLIESLVKEKNRSNKITSRIIDQFIQFLHEENKKPFHELADDSVYQGWAQKVKESMMQEVMRMQFSLFIVQLRNLKKINRHILFMEILTKYISKTYLEKHITNCGNLLINYKKMSYSLIENTKEISQHKLKKDTLYELEHFFEWLSSESQKLPKERFKKSLYTHQKRRIYFHLFSEIDPRYRSFFEKLKLYWLKSISDFNS